MTVADAAAQQALHAAARQAANRGLRFLTHERVKEAIEALRESTTLVPDDPDVHAFLAAALFADADHEGATRHGERSLELAPDGYWPNLKAGELAERLGDLAAAEGYLLVALRAVEPGTPESVAAASALVRIRKQLAKSIDHRAAMPRVPFRLRRRGRAPSAPLGEA